MPRAILRSASEAYLPVLLTRDQLTEGNSKLALRVAVSEGAAPGLAGVLVQLITAPLAVLLDAVSFLLSAALVFRTRGVEHTASEGSSVGDARRIFTEMMEGIAVIVRQPILRSITLAGALLGFTGGVYDALLILFVTRTLRLPLLIVGALYTVGSVTGILGTLLGAPVTRKLGIGRTIVISATLISVGWLGVPLAYGSTGVAIALMLLGMVFAGIGNTTYNIGVASVRQATTPNRVLGRVTSAEMMVSFGTLSLGGLVGGFGAAAIGIRQAILVAGLARLALLAIVLLRSPLRKVESLAEAEDTDT